jgi:hypothetical protein
MHYTMSEELKPNVLSRFADLGARKSQIDSSAQQYAIEVQQAVTKALGEVAKLDEAWRYICHEVLEGRTAQMQVERDRFLHAYEEWLHVLDEARELVHFAQRVARRDLPELAQLEHEANVRGRTLKDLIARWQTGEDLEDLAAESIAPSAEKLEAIRRQYGFPEAWYNDDSKPF